MALHETPSRSNEWYTPAHVFEAMGTRFDLDAASPFGWWTRCPADDWCGDRIASSSLERDWYGFVWLNPPFGPRNGLEPWLAKFFQHANGIILVPDRTSAPWWQTWAPKADMALMVARKIKFIPGPGAVASSPAQGTTLLAIGPRGVEALRNAARNGLGSLWRPDHD